MAWTKIVKESSAGEIAQKAATAGNADTVTNGVYTTLVSTATLGWVADEDNMASDSATKVPTQQSVKAYVDAQVDTADAISELADTTIAGTIANNEVLAWDGSSAWINQTAVEAGLQPNDSALTQLATYVPQEVTRGIADGNLSRIDQDGVANDDYAKFTANGLEGRDATQVKTDLGLGTGDSPQFTGLTLTGNLDVQGTTTTIDSANLSVTDPHIMLNVLADQTDYTTGDSAIIFGHTTNASGGKIVNAAGTGFKFTALHASDDPASGTLVGEGSVTAGAYVNAYMKGVVLEEISEPSPVINGMLYFDGTDIFIGTD